MRILLPTPRAAVAFAAFLLATAAPSHAQARASRASSPATDGGARTLRHDGLVRRYVVRVPRGLSRTDAPLPVVIMFHGGGGNAASAEQMSGFTALVARERLIAVYPDGTGRNATRLLTWNAGHCCGHAMERRADDVGFIDAVLDTLATLYPIDPRRIYLTGMSNGGMITHRMGRELRHRPAAIAPVVGAVFGDEAPATGPVSALIINGLLDTSVPAQGGLGDGIGRRAWDGTPPLPNLAQGTYWARTNGCAGAPSLEETATLLTWRYACPAGRDVMLIQVKRGGHSWFGGRAGRRLGADTPSRDLDATETIWAFFESHVRP